MRSSIVSDQSRFPSCKGRSIDSRLAHKHFEKDFIKENVRKLREIQAKCRGQESKLPPRNVPLKAFRKDIGPSPSIGQCKKDRIGSGHSDYFSLSDGLPSATHSGKLHVTSGSIPHSLNKTPRNSSGNFPARNLLKEQSRSLSNLGGAAPTAPDAVFPLKKPLFTSSSMLPSFRKGKVGSVLERVKSRKPSCETNTGNVWHDIESDHKALFGRKNILMPHYASNNGCGRSGIGNSSPWNPSNLRKSPSLNEISSFRKAKSFNLASSDSTAKRDASVGKSNLPNAESAQVLEGDQSERSVSSKASTELDWDDCPSNFRRTSSLPRLSSTDDPDIKELDQDDGIPSNTPDVEQYTLNPLGKIVTHSDDSNIISPLKGTTSPSKTFSDTSMQRNPNLERLSKPAHRPVLSKAYTKSRPISRSKSFGNLKCDPPPTYKRGEVPKYLLARREEERKRREAAIVDPACPPGHTLLPDEERKNTLELLLKGHTDVLGQISRLPLVQDTLRVKRLRDELESKLTRIEEGIEIFSQPKVYVVDDE